MGADLYLNKVFKAQEAQYKPLFDKWANIRDKAVTDEDKKLAQEKVSEYYEKMYARGYFRDSYNSSSVMWLFGISWWTDVVPMVKDGELDPAGSKKLLAMLKEREETFEKKLAEFKDFDPKQDTKQDIDKYFRSKYASLQAFLQEAIDTNEPIDCSL